jgi:iron-sulfur cluster repair protein YtfE (RIC family)
MKLTPSRTLAELIAQHDALRELMDRCEALADQLDQQAGDPLDLTREIARLRTSFDAHNKFEEQLLRPVLLAEDSFGAVRVDRMVEDHVHEHAAMGARLGSPSTSGLRDVIETLRAHLEAEERYLLSSKVLRDDLVTVEGGG